jgi:glycerol-3-phosphate acyltransferase PlsX
MTPKPIILDCLGGDRPLEQNTEAVLNLLSRDGARVPLMLVGPEQELRERLELGGVRQIPGHVQFVHCETQLSMDQHAAEVLKSQDNTLMKSLQLLKEGVGCAVVSAGHTGAVFMASIKVLGKIDGVLRPAIGVLYPSLHHTTLLLDGGANVDCKPEYLFQFGLLGAAFYKQTMGKHFMSKPSRGLEKVTVALLNNGEEPSKGTKHIRQAYDLMQSFKQLPWIEFQGMMDASALFGAAPHVLVADGYVGNIVVKTVESLMQRLKSELKSQWEKSGPLSKFGLMLFKNRMKAFRGNLDFEEIGGAPLLGVNGTVFIAHGRSDGPTLAQCVRRAQNSHFEDYAKQLKQVLATVGSA